MNKKERKRLRRQQRQSEGATIAPSAFPDADVIPNTEEGTAPTPAKLNPVQRKMMVEFQAYTGPIPPPTILAQYEQICPGAASRIITQFEEQGRHRRVIERRTVNYNVGSALFGQIASLILFLAALGLGGFLIYNDKPTGGITAIIAAVASAAWTLHKAGVFRKKELDKKREEAIRRR